ncbi:Nuclear actin-protein involved in chromatin remodeling [Malassezia vespertilionis]|uniref:Nuclear actin-protein involved in chromatin remodeling n=1 Tax=Malassezia vespertilionis TaxID=2020962 RepID=UPI0024B0F685|nr:Nuclear actin-protein involved in chromatin remodeling [Malassezia vespertilionis]WFD05516.1 Nuclear actin-protein involved in chromatin remodeling [Malassezia vespertilionis]
MTARIQEVAEWPSPKPIPALKDYRASVHWAQHAPILLDNGDTSPLYYDNIVSKFKDRKRNTNIVLCGNDCYVDAQGRAAIKNAFDGDVVCGFDTMECMLDFTFGKLGIDTDRVEHPMMLTETLCNPEYSRGPELNELLFEAYNVPSVNYGLDALFAAYQNGIRDDGLVVSAGKSTTIVVPIVQGRGVLENAKRLAWGGALASDFLLRLLQLKYPNLPQRITSYESQCMMEDLCYVASDYDAEIRALSVPENMAAIDRVVQLPFTPPERKEKTQEELDKITERKKAASQRLVEQTRVMRQEKALQNENDLQYYTLLREWKEKESPEEYLQRLEGEGFNSERDFEKTLKRLDEGVRRSRGEEVVEEDKTPPAAPLADVPDAELDEEGIKEKRRQRLLKAGYDARMRARAEKEEEQRLQAEAEAEERREQNENPEAWVAKVRAQYQDSLQHIQERKRLRETLPDRKSAAAQQRMKNITALASEQEQGSGSQRRRKRGDDDTFGADDSDWAVYRSISDSVDAEEEREEQTKLVSLEAKLLAFDPTFTADDTYAAMLAKKTRLTNTFIRGFAPPWDPEDVAQYHQVHLNVERIRVPEISWQPLIAGVDQAGVAELSRHVLHGVDAPLRARMARNVLVTGRYATLSGFDTRLASALRASLDPATQFSVRRARSPRFDPWCGMRQWVTDETDTFRASSVTRAEYEEKGEGWFKEHPWSACR